VIRAGTTACAVVVALAALGLGGCATPPSLSSAADDGGPLGGPLGGRLALRVAAHEGRAAQSISASFELRGSAEAGELRLASPLGTLMASARWSTAGAWLDTADGERRFNDVQALSLAALGEALPLQALADWLRGRPWPGAPSRIHDGGFEQLGWRVSAGAVATPATGRVDAVREAPPPVVTLRAVLDGPR